jgi:hypothetical protein
MVKGTSFADAIDLDDSGNSDGEVQAIWPPIRPIQPSMVSFFVE